MGSDSPRRIQRRRSQGWRMPAGAVNVTRPCDWSNPFRIGDRFTVHTDGDLLRGGVITTPRLAVILFQAYVADRFERQIREELAGKDLVCWCPPEAPWCHADVLLRIANEGDDTL